MAAVVSSSVPPSPAQRSPWHSPVPYLFGGLAAMLGLIAFALLILACSYWKLSGYLENGEGAERDLEAGDETGDSSGDLKAPPVFEEKFLVIMAGQEKPTFLATPMSSRASSFGSNSCSNETAEKSEEVTEKSKQECGDQVQLGDMENHETLDQVP
ncbi:hypothetical protein RJ640_015193 [Escallonia rubra]|uniref:Uncharacterized protein n=1 Tax=Escallonia rubra TaxID=112253 RepID=A0AA88UQC7_9ASTE|nr:hypothetical protein RJ640_015193 [Escallonia rubra]